MSLSLLFDPVSEDICRSIQDIDAWVESIMIHKEKLPRWQRKHMAIIGLQEERGTHTNLGVAQGADQIRYALYRLKKGTGNYNIVDLGNLRNGPTLEDTYDRLSQVCETLLEKKVLPILIGGSHDLCLGQYAGYESMGKLVTVVNVDARLDMEESTTQCPSARHTHLLLSQKPNYLFDYNHLAYQSYLNTRPALEVLEQLYFEAYSVGQMRQDFNEVEPVVRQADMLSFDISAIKMNDAPGHTQAPVMGLTSEEACQICWFAGLNEKLTSIGFYEYNPALDERQKTAQLVATMVWYFVEGYYHRVKREDFESNAYMKYVVSALDNSSQMIFYKHKVTQKWWMEVPYPNEVSHQQESITVPCSYKDYQTASRGEVPDRWINTYAKLV